MDRLSEHQAKQIVFNAQEMAYYGEEIPKALRPLYQYIEAVEAEIAQLRAERDAAAEDMRVCAYDEAQEGHASMCNFCSRVLDCPDDHRDPEEIENRCDFRWRGLEAEKQC